MFWHVDCYAPRHPRERILPHGGMEITFSLDSAPFRIDYPDSATSVVVPEAMVAGPRTGHFLIDTSRPQTLLSVWFKAGGALPFFGVDGAELLNAHLALTALWGHEAAWLTERLCVAKTARVRFALLEAALCQRLQDASQRHPAVYYALERVAAAPEAVSVATLVADLALSPTRFIQVFKRDVGLTPKRFSRVQRFQAAVQAIARGDALSWTDLALRLGYYDQAHFINEFRAFAGMAPSGFVPQDPDHPSNLVEG